MFSATITAANLFAFDIENRTEKEISLTPLSNIYSGIVIITSSVLLAFVLAISTLFVGMFAFILEFEILLMIVIGIIPVLIICVVIGIMIVHFILRYGFIQTFL